MKCWIKETENLVNPIHNHLATTNCNRMDGFECSDKIRSQVIVDYIFNNKKKGVYSINSETCFYTIDGSLSRYVHGNE